MDIDRAIADAETLFVEASQAKVRAQGMDYKRKRTRAILFVKYKAEGNAVGASEHMAEADPVYGLAVTEWENAAMEAETLQAQADGMKLKFEAWRTKNATKRAQMTLR